MAKPTTKIGRARAARTKVRESNKRLDARREVRARNKPSAKVGHWFHDMSVTAKKAYIKAHPNSMYAKSNMRAVTPKRAKEMGERGESNTRYHVEYTNPATKQKGFNRFHSKKKADDYLALLKVQGFRARLHDRK